MRTSITTLVLLIAAKPTFCAEEANDSRYVGSSSCATFGCHGNSVTRGGDAWKSSFVRWKRSDPHARAVEVLLNERSAEMVELLAQIRSDGDEYEREYWSVLEKRCIGCHATPAAIESKEPSSTHRSLSESLRQGVNCESCHGPASKWITEHATSRWTNYSSTEKRDEWGLHNTRDLSSRAGICVDCHVGPHIASSGQVFGVTHELIAAGHPRLSFEFSAYLANLPPHWDEAQDKSRAGAADFHFDAWRIGQFQTARKLASQLEVRSSQAGDDPYRASWPDLSNYDCFDCHHRLRADRAPADRGLTKTPGQPQPADWPFAQLEAVVRSSTNESTRNLSRPLAVARKNLATNLEEWPARDQREKFFAQLHAALGESLNSVSVEKLSPRDRLTILESLLTEIAEGRAASWDHLVQFDLAVMAYLADSHDGQLGGNLAVSAQRLSDYLDGCFQTTTLSLYNSPDRFDSRSPTLRKHVLAVGAALKSAQQTSGPTDRPAP